MVRKLHSPFDRGTKLEYNGVQWVTDHNRNRNLEISRAPLKSQAH